MRHMSLGQAKGQLGGEQKGGDCKGGWWCSSCKMGGEIAMRMRRYVDGEHVGGGWVCRASLMAMINKRRGMDGSSLTSSAAGNPLSKCEAMHPISTLQCPCAGRIVPTVSVSRASCVKETLLTDFPASRSPEAQ